MILLTRPPGWNLRRRARGLAVRAPQARGPEAVAASLCRGLTRISAPFALNPRRLPERGVVGVLSDLDALEAAIRWRRQGEGRRLLAGPNLVVLPSDAPEFMTAPEIDVCVVPSEWVRRLYEEDSPSLAGRVAVWPAGVDADRWSPPPAGSRRAPAALVYLKEQIGQDNPTADEVDEVMAALAAAGLPPRLIRYGEATADVYLEALHAVDVMVFFSPTESQCLALVEAWSTGVPTLVWSCGRLRYRGRLYTGSSAPYLSPRTGAEFADAAALRRMLERWPELRDTFDPRGWVLERMTDARSAAAYAALAR